MRLFIGVGVMLAASVFAFMRTLGSSDDSLRIDQKQAVSTDAPALGSLVTWDHYLAWVSIPDPSGKGGKVVVHDLENNKTKTIATDLYAGGLSWVRGSKDTVVYMWFEQLSCDDKSEKERQASGCSRMPRAWRVMAHDLKNGKSKQLAKSSTEAQKGLFPLPEVSWPHLVWTSPPAEPALAARGIVLHNLKEDKRMVLVSGTIVARATIDQDTLLFTGAVPGQDRWDLFSVSAKRKSTPKRLSTSGRVVFPRASDGLVAWQEPSAPQPGENSADFSLWARSVKGKGRPVRIAASGNNPIPGDGFVVWLTPLAEGGQLLAKDPYSKAEPIVLEQQANFGAGWWAFGDRVVWATVRKDGEKLKTIIHVARVRVG